MPGLPITAPTVHIRDGYVGEDILGVTRILPEVDNPESARPMVGPEGVISCAICVGNLSFDDALTMEREGEEIFLCTPHRRSVDHHLEAFNSASVERR